ncbi:MAG TPA: RsiV family protein, partial [Pyrinomonadaceae bacterium]
FKPGAAYLKTIAAYCAKDLQARTDPDTHENMGFATDIFADGVQPTVPNFGNWAITKKGLLILFPPYQVSAYAYGPQSVIVPYSVLKTIARADGPVLKMK